MAKMLFESFHKMEDMTKKKPLDLSKCNRDIYSRTQTIFIISKDAKLERC